MTTNAGRRLLDEEWDNFDAKPWGSLADHVAAIEAEKEAEVRARLAAEVKALECGCALCVLDLIQPEGAKA